MIADLRFVAAAPADAFAVEMYWKATEPMGSIEAPFGLIQWVEQECLPSLDPLPVVSAVAYAMILAFRTDSDLVVTGDASAWLPKWGRLIPSG